MKHASLPHVPRRGGCHKLPYDSRLTAAHRRRQAGKKSFESHLQRTSLRGLAHGASTMRLITSQSPRPPWSRRWPRRMPSRSASPTTFRVRSRRWAPRPATASTSPSSSWAASWAASPPNSCRPTWAAIPTRPASWSRATCSARRSISSPARSARTWRWPWAPRCSPPRSPTCPTTRAPASSPAPSAIRTGSAPRTRTTPSTRPPARSRPTAASRRCSSWPRLSGGQGRAQRLQARLQGRPGDEVYTKLGQIDYAAELAQIRAAKPDAVYIFLPGGMGINFVKQFVSAGLSQSIKLIGPASRPMRT